MTQHVEKLQEKSECVKVNLILKLFPLTQNK